MKGLYCSQCRAHRLAVYCTHHPAPGITIRYLRCSACDARLKSREEVVKVTRPGRRPTTP